MVLGFVLTIYLLIEGRQTYAWLIAFVYARKARDYDAMAEALDAFEVEGIGHNLPFLSAVMAHPRFRPGFARRVRRAARSTRARPRRWAGARSLAA